MKKVALILSGLLLSVSALAANGVVDTENGKRLYEESDKCLRCHAEGEAYADIFTRDERASDKAKLESWVRSCDVKFKTNWFDDEIMDVVAYLDKTFYQFPNVETSKTEGEVTKTEVVVAE